MPTDDKLSKERFTRTKIYDYDQITSVSQRGINNQFDVIFQNSDARLRHFTTNTTEDDDWTQIVDAELAPPVLELLLGTDEKQRALFTFKLTSGSFKYLGGPIKKPNEETASIKNWTVVFDVRFKLKIVQDQDVPRRIKEALKNMPNYAIHGFIVDYSNVDLSKYDENRSIIDLPTDRAKHSFVTSIGLYLTNPAGILHSAIYYLLTLQNSAIDHFPGHSIFPTNLTFQNLPFVASSSDHGTRNSDDNMLVYLQMTEGRALPRNLLPFPSANWIVPPTNTDPKGRYDGTIGLSERVLFTPLSLFNQYSTWVTESVNKGSGPLPVIKGHCGYVDEELPVKGVPWVYDPKSSTPGSRKYVYTQRSTTKLSTDVPLTFQDALTQNRLEVPVGLDENGRCVIKLEGKTEVVTAIAGVGTAIQSGTWSGEVTLDSSSQKDVKIMLKITPRHVLETIFGDEVRSVVQPFKDSLERSFARLDSDELRVQLTGWLTGTWKFVFPSYGEFVIKEAAFNSEGDLLIKVV